MSTPIDPTHSEAMNLIAKQLDDQLNPLRFMTGKRVTGFYLAVFDFDNPDGRFNYISNADKLDVRKIMQDVLARLDHRAGENTEEMVVVSRASIAKLKTDLAGALAARDAALATHSKLVLEREDLAARLSTAEALLAEVEGRQVVPINAENAEALAEIVGVTPEHAEWVLRCLALTQDNEGNVRIPAPSNTEVL